MNDLLAIWAVIVCQIRDLLYKLLLATSAIALTAIRTTLHG